MADTKELIIKLTMQNQQLLDANKKMQKGVTNTKKKVTGLGTSINKLKALYIALGGVIVGVVVKAFTVLVRKASDAQETLSKFSVVFKDVRKEADKVAKNFAKNFGLSSVAAKTLLSDTGDLLTGFGFTGKAALDLSKEVNELAVDLASFTNFSGGAEGASKALTKALLGERESVKSLGVSILETDVKAKVLELTQQGLVFETDRQARAYATLKIAQDQSKNAIGDFSRTSQDFANQMRILKGRFDDYVLVLAEKLLPIAAPIVSFFSKLLKTDKSLSDVTTELVNANKEYAQITNTLAKTTGDLTAKEERKLKVRQSELRLDITKRLTEINDLNKEQVETIPKLTKKIENQNKAQARYAKLIKQIEDGEVARFERAPRGGALIDHLAGAQNSFNNALTKEAALNDTLTKLEDERTTGLESIAFALKNNLLTKADLAGIDKELIEEAMDLDEQVVVSDTVKTEALIKNVKALSDANEEAAEKEKAFADFKKAQNINLVKSSSDLLTTLAAQQRTHGENNEKAAKAAWGLSVASAILQRALSIFQIVTNTKVAVAKAIAFSPTTFGQPYAGIAIASGIAGGAAVAAAPLPKKPEGFAQGGMISGLSGGFGGEDGIIAAQNGESVLNKQATTELGASTINALNAGQTVPGGNITVNVADGRGAVDMLDDYFRTRGTSERGLAI